MTERIRELRRRTISLALAGIVVLLFMLQCFCITAYADEAPSILDDFNGTEFNIEDYPEKEGDYSLNVFQVAESSNDELFVYVYQPSVGRKLLATTIRFSTSIGMNAEFRDRVLEYEGSTGTIYKYKVKDFNILGDALRYYLVAAIHREWDLTIDGELPGGQTGGEAVYPVGKLWTASTVNGEVSYTVEVQDVVNVKVKHTGFLRYANGVSWSALESFDSHWAAYKFDRSMDEVLSADFEFTEVKYAKKIIDKEEKIIEENPEPTKVHITSDQVGTNEQDLKWLGKKHEWQRISRTEEFMSAHGAAFDSDTRTALEDTDWVFQFYETPYTNTQTGGGLLLGGLISHWVTLIGMLVGECTGTHLTGQTLLQLTFKKAGVTTSATSRGLRRTRLPLRIFPYGCISWQ